ncbi:Subtilase family protein [Ruminococcus sp. YRD2003]|uniref:S8 family serine peptidase n=1 Tax=Ruminococcus sp. YRD2003 TaxID=1452313 RepID=UPI0008B448CD|nr:Subtilase family protein [Ruminococcus flavefaciens]
MIKKKHSLFLPFFSILVVIALILGSLDVFLYTKLRTRLNFKTMQDTELVDMTDPNANTEFGKLYYSPIDEEHVIVEDERSGSGYIDNEVLVVAEDGVNRGQIAELAASYGAEIVGEIEVSGDYQLRLATTPDEIVPIVKSIATEAIVDSATLNYVDSYEEELFESSERFGEFYYGREWDNYTESDDGIVRPRWALEAINTDGAWEELQTNSDIVPIKVGVCDAGFYTEHDDLGFSAYFYENGANHIATSLDEKDHGTHVSGTFAASTDDETGICGVYPYGNGRLYAASAWGAYRYQDLKGIHFSSMSTKAAYGEMIIRNVKVINFSMGNGLRKRFADDEGYVDDDALINCFSDPSQHIDTLEKSRVIGDYFNRLLEKGFDFVIVTSAGNDSDDYTGNLEAKYNSFLTIMERDEYPNVYDRIIVVGSLDQELNVSCFSNGGTRTDIYAPGEGILSAVSGYKTYGEKYTFKGGTSMASPHVAGVAAMVWTANNSLTGAQVKDIVVNSPNYRTDEVNMLDAALCVQKALGVERTTAPTSGDNGIIFAYVRDKYDEMYVVSNIRFTATNTETGEAFISEKDDDGHVELPVPAGKYKLSVTADGYRDWKWPGNFSYMRTFTVTKNTIKYLDTIMLTPTDDHKTALLEDGKIHTGDDIKRFMGSKYKSYDYGEALSKVKAWTYRNGHLYAVCDYAVSAKFMSLITKQDPTVHLVIIDDEEEQALIEELITYGERDVYYTGGLVNSDGSVYAVNFTETDYTHWQEGYPNDYGQNGLDDVIAVFRGSGDDPTGSEDFGYWLEVPENALSYLDIADFDVNGVTRGIIIEWDNPIT